MDEVRKIIKLIGTVWILLLAGTAHANLVSFRIQSSMTCWFECSSFYADTGLSPTGGAIAVNTLFTVETNAAPQSVGLYQSQYLVNQPGTGMSVTVGNLTLFYSGFRVSLGSAGGSTGCNSLTVDSKLITGSQWALFNTSSCHGPLSTEPLSEYTLDGLANADLSGFYGTPFDTVLFGGVDNWMIQGAVAAVTRVPEPSALSLLISTLLGLAWIRRHRLTTRR